MVRRPPRRVACSGGGGGVAAGGGGGPIAVVSWPRGASCRDAMQLKRERERERARQLSAGESTLDGAPLPIGPAPPFDRIVATLCLHLSLVSPANKVYQGFLAPKIYYLIVVLIIAAGELLAV